MRVPLLFIAVLFFYSCNSNKSANKNVFKYFFADTTLNERAKNELTFSQRQSEHLNLSNIFNGVDSFELRAWSFGFWTRKDLFILRYSKNKWISSNYTYYDNDKTVDSLYQFKNLVNQDSAYKLSRYLCSDSVLKLPTQIDIPNFQDNTSDGETFYIEISNKHFYKLLRYHNPQHFNETYNKQFMQLLHKINESHRVYLDY